MSGLFITFEGSEACGKSTQVKRLETRLLQSGRETITVHEPGFTAIGREIRHLLLHANSNESMFAETELLLFAASRSQLVREIIQPALARGVIVVSDRFYDSTTVYQGVARGLSLPFIRQLNEFTIHGCKPDRTFILDLDVKIANERRLRRVRSSERADRIEELPLEFFLKVRSGYQQLAAAEPERIKLVAAEPAAEEIEMEIWKEIDGLLG
jgi:dTMP kinase